MRRDDTEQDDYPMYRQRSLMIDSGRRFWPMDLVKDVMDSMSFVKMNVLLLHAVDFCRFGIESKLYPALQVRYFVAEAG